MNRFTRHNARRFNVCNTACCCFDRAFAVDRVTQTVNNATKKCITDWNVHDGLRTFNRIAFFDVTVGTEDNNTNVVNLEVQRHSADTTGEFNHFASLNVVEAVYTRNTVTDG